MSTLPTKQGTGSLYRSDSNCQQSSIQEQGHKSGFDSTLV